MKNTTLEDVTNTFKNILHKKLRYEIDLTNAEYEQSHALKESSDFEAIDYETTKEIIQMMYDFINETRARNGARALKETEHNVEMTMEELETSSFNVLLQDRFFTMLHEIEEVNKA